ncbi:MAG: hypothetical protein PUB93_06495, partial [Firmicutes bacterium]|nr:hypothetical protein [Bacillota bacterium]
MYFGAAIAAPKNGFYHLHKIIHRWWTDVNKTKRKYTDFFQFLFIDCKCRHPPDSAGSSELSLLTAFPP